MTGRLFADVVQDEARGTNVAAKAIVITRRVTLFIGFSPMKLLLFNSVF